jgi:hypothetical protein
MMLCGQQDKKAAVATLLNFGPGLPVPPVTSLGLNVSLPFLPTKVESVEHGSLPFHAMQAGGGSSHVVRLTVPALEFADFVKFT